MQAIADSYSASPLENFFSSTSGLLSHCGMFNAVCRPFLSAYSSCSPALGHCQCVGCQSQCAPSSCPLVAPLLSPHVPQLQSPQMYGCVASGLPVAELQLRYASCSFPSGERPASSCNWYPQNTAEARTATAEMSPRNTEQCLHRNNLASAAADQREQHSRETAPAYRSQLGNRQPRKDRLSFTIEQLQELEQSFARKKYLCLTQRQELAEKVGVSEAQVKTWYQNRRTKWKRNYKICDFATDRGVDAV